jgi:bacterioferritin-associated ferredoxin
MIVCSCTVVTDREIEAAVASILAEDPRAVVTPGRLARRLDRRLVCHGCLPLVAATLATALERRRERTIRPTDQGDRP